MSDVHPHAEIMPWRMLNGAVVVKNHAAVTTLSCDASAAGLGAGAAGTGNGADPGGESLSDLAAMGLVTRDTRIDAAGMPLLHVSRVLKNCFPAFVSKRVHNVGLGGVMTAMVHSSEASHNRCSFAHRKGAAAG